MIEPEFRQRVADRLRTYPSDQAENWYEGGETDTVEAAAAIAEGRLEEDRL